jgi:alpha-galactosidase
VGRLAAEIPGAGLRPGIWTAPFLAGPKSALARAHPEWLARHRVVRAGRQAVSARPCRAMRNQLAWGGWAMALDTTRPEVLDHLRQSFSALRADGWTYHKIDFCYAAALPAGRHGDGRFTRAQALRAGLEAVRDGIGEDAVLLGCGVPLAQSVGIVDTLRVSPDTAPSWRPGLLRLPGYPDLAPSASAAVQVSVLRAPMHRRLWVNDPDCLLLRPTDTRLSASERRLLATVVGGAGGFTILSDDLATYGREEWRLVDQLVALHRRADTRLDIADPFAAVPVVRGVGGLTLTVDWTGTARPAGPDAAPATVSGERAPGATLLAGGEPGHGPWARLDGGGADGAGGHR